MQSDRGVEIISATEARRSLSKILDRVEQGRRFVIERHGKRICLLAPQSANGRRASECLALLRGRADVILDDRFGEDLLAVVAGEPTDRRPRHR